MADIYTTLWSLVLQVYAAIYQAGYLGCLIAFAAGVFLNKLGVKVTGRPTVYTGRNSSFRDFTIIEHPAVLGTAKTKLEYILGVLLKVVGSVSAIMSVIAFVHVTFG